MLKSVYRAAIMVGAAVVLLGCQGVPADYKPDPKLATATMPQLQAGVAAACIKTQKAKQSASTAELTKPCGCYAAGAFKAMDKTEVDYYRANGFFADSARPKAQAALNACGLN